MRPRRLGISNYTLFWKRQVQNYPEPKAGKRLLEQFKGDPSAMRDLRALLDESLQGFTNSRMSDDQVLEGISRLLASGELLIVREWPLHGGAATTTQASAGGSTQAASPPPVSSNSQAPESPTLPPNTNGSSQAAALTSAAQSGAPFCEH